MLKLTQAPRRSSGRSIRTSAPGARRLAASVASLPAVAHVDGRNTSDSVRRHSKGGGPPPHCSPRRTVSLTCFDAVPDHGGRGGAILLLVSRLRRLVDAERGSRVLRERLNCRRDGRATEHAPRGPFYLLERRPAAEIVERGAVIQKSAST